MAMSSLIFVEIIAYGWRAARDHNVGQPPSDSHDEGSSRRCVAMWCQTLSGVAPSSSLLQHLDSTTA
jgi:hypothetical protein